MQNTENQNRLIVPALRSYMGDWVYYACCLKLQDASERISLVEEIHDSKQLDELIQRSLTARSQAIKTYLIEQPQRFFNALVIGVYGGEPNFAELAVNVRETIIGSIENFDLKGILGFLIFSGQEKLFAIDGQHRLKGIIEALKENPELGKEEICAIFMPHQRDDEGLKRTRRLFTTLNRYAKPVNKSEIISLDEDDIVAIVVRRLINEFEIFKDTIAVKKGKNLLANDKKSLTTIEALYDALDFYLRFDPLPKKLMKKWNEFKTRRPSDNDVNSYYSRSVNLFETIYQEIDEFRCFIQKNNSDERALEWRHNNGGNLIFRPFGFIAIIKTITRLLKDHSLSDAVKLVVSIQLELSLDPWVGLIWDMRNHKMIVEYKSTIVEQILYYSVSTNISTWWRGKNENTLITALAGALNKPESEIELPRYI